MLPAGWLIAAVLVAIVLTSWITFTLTRLDRLHARVDAAQAALDAQLVRRAAAVQHLGEMPGSGVPDETARHLVQTARSALAIPNSEHEVTDGALGPGIRGLDSSSQDRRVAENEVGRAIAGLAGLRERLPAAAVEELSEAATRVMIARRFFNDAVRDTRTLRSRRMPRLLHLAGRREPPQFFDIDDTSLFLAGSPTTDPTGSRR